MKENRTMKTIAHTVLSLGSVMALMPFILLIICSFTDNEWAIANGFSFIPGKWSIDAYLYIANKWQMIGRAYIMTIIITVIGTAVSILITSLFGYAISNGRLPGRKLFSFLIIFTMLFNGGLVATYYTYVNIFHIRNTLWALILPNLLMNPFSVILMKNYFSNSIPANLTEAARIDGAGEFQIFFRIVYPLSLPIVATVGIMTGIAYWNDWQNGLYYLTARDGGKFYTIQIVLNTINENIQYLSANSGDMITGVQNMPGETARMAIAVIGIIPIIIAYPFFQKYFVKGITLGGVKE